MTEKFSVQIVIIREILIDATDDLQAEREAYQKMGPRDRASAIALKVFDNDDGECGDGALTDNRSDAWRYARDHFHAIDIDWVS